MQSAGCLEWSEISESVRILTAVQNLVRIKLDFLEKSQKNILIQILNCRNVQSEHTLIRFRQNTWISFK